MLIMVLKQSLQALSPCKTCQLQHVARSLLKYNPADLMSVHTKQRDCVACHTVFEQVDAVLVTLVYQ